MLISSVRTNRQDKKSPQISTACYNLMSEPIDKTKNVIRSVLHAKIICQNQSTRQKMSSDQYGMLKSSVRTNRQDKKCHQISMASKNLMSDSINKEKNVLISVLHAKILVQNQSARQKCH